MSNQAPPKRDPREPTPLVLMNPELRVRQLRYAANIEASLMVPIHRYYEVLLDLSMMGLEYLKSMKLERAFIIFKRIEYFIFHRLNLHPGVNTFASAAKQKILSRLPMIMYVAQQIIVDFVLPVYERQAAYFRYEELQRRLKLLNPTAWQGIMAEAARREAEFYSEAEEISTRFGVELASFLPQQVVPDDNHPSNFPPRTFPATTTPPKRSQAATDREAMQAAINAMNQTLERLPINADQPVEALVRNINSMMNEALNKFFNLRVMAMTGQPLPEVPVHTADSVNLTTRMDNDVILVAEDSTHTRTSYSPGVAHMYSVPPNPPTSSQPYVPPAYLTGEDTQQRMVYNPTYSLDSYVDLLTKTFDMNSSAATGFSVLQYKVDATAQSTVAFTLKLEPIEKSSHRSPEDTNPRLLDYAAAAARILKMTPSAMIPEPDPGMPRANPPLKPDSESSPETLDNFGIWQKRGSARGPDGVGSLGVLSHLDRAREVLDARPPMPAGIDQVGTHLTTPKKRQNGNEESSPRKKKTVVFAIPSNSSRNQDQDQAIATRTRRKSGTYHQTPK